MQYLEFGDYLLIAEQILQVPAKTLAGLERIGLADSAIKAPAAGFAGVEAYPDFETKAAVLCWHLVKNHPLPDGNKPCAFWRWSSSSNATAAHGPAHQTIRRRLTGSFVRSRPGSYVRRS